MQYFRAHFGAPPEPGTFKFVLADPLTMCNKDTTPVLYNRASVDGFTVVVAKRGECNHSEKAILAHETGAAAILFINTEEGNSHPSGPEAHDLSLSASMIGRYDGERLLDALNATFDQNMEGKFVPISCLEGKSKTMPSLESHCAPVRSKDRQFISALDFRGKIVANGEHKFEYVQAEFGGRINPHSGQWGLAGSVSEHYCNLTIADGELQGMAVLVGRGGCDFATKAEILSEAGARIMILANYNETIFRMGVDTEYRGRQIPIAAVMVTKSTGSQLSLMVNGKTKKPSQENYIQLEHGCTQM